MSCNSFFLMRKNLYRVYMLILKKLGLISRCCKKISTNLSFFCTPTLCLHPFSAASTGQGIVPNFHAQPRRVWINHDQGRSWPRCDKKVTLLKVQAVCDGIFTLRVSGVSCFVFLLRRYIRFIKLMLGLQGRFRGQKIA